MEEESQSGGTLKESEKVKVLRSREFDDENKGNELKVRDFDLNENAAIGGFDYDNERLESSLREEIGTEEINGLGNEERKKDRFKTECRTLGLVDNGLEGSRTGDSEEGGVKKRRKKRVKGQVADGNVQITRRVLRSSVALRCGPEKSENKESEGDLVGDGKIENDGDEEKLDDAGVEDRNHSCNNVRTEVKCKRGRPRKVQQTEGPDSMGKESMKLKNGNKSYDNKSDKSYDKRRKGLKRKRGRPPKQYSSNQSDSDKVELKCKPGELHKSRQSDGDGITLKPKKLHKSRQSDGDGITLKPKRGRPPKLHGGHQSVVCGSKLGCKSGRPSKVQEIDGADFRRMKKMKRKRGRPPKLQNSNQSSDYEPRKLNHMHGYSQVQEDDKSDCEVRKKFKHQSGPSDSEDSDQCDNERRRRGGKKIEQNETGEHSRSGAKQLVRERIVELLLAAGWTVEYRPRNGRMYNDAVYVSPQGKTHWSVTLAYKVYKEQCECCSDKPEFSRNTFALLTEEEFGILKRKTQKERNDKGKSRPKRNDGDTAKEVLAVKKTSKQKLQKGKLLKRKLRKQKLKLSASRRANLLKRKLKGSTLSQKIDGMSPSKVPMSNEKHSGQERRSRKQCALLARNSLEGAESDGGGYVLYEGKRTLLGWMIDLATVPLNGNVQYMNGRKTRVLLEGRITKDGIQCNCCGEVFSISDFEIHAGSKLNQPFKNLYIEDGNSLLECLRDSWNKQDEPQHEGFHFVDISNGDPNDDTCGICGDGGDLICCDGCPSTFHQNCLDIKKFPSGDWFCIHCTCKFCGKVGEATHQRDNVDNAALSPLSTCCSCEEKYHQSCIEETVTTVDDGSKLSFCSKDCQELSERLQTLLGVKQEMPGGFSWTLLRRFDIDPDASLSEVAQKIECNCKLAVAFFVLDECFSPLVDHRSGINLLQNIVYNFGSNFNRLNYKGFYTAILERGDEIIGVASIRIHGNQLAEMPFIGTRHMYRRQGMCRRLMSGIESTLSSLKVEKLVIPAVSELTETWTSVFGFKAVEEASKQKIRNLNMLVFPHVDMLQKPSFKHSNSAEDNANPIDGSRSYEFKIWQTADKEANNSDGKCFTELDLDVPHQSVSNINGKSDKVADTESQSPVSDDYFEDTTVVTREASILTESGCKMKDLIESVASSENPEGMSTNVPDSKDPVPDACRPTTDISERHAATIASMADTKPLENIVPDPIIRRFACHIV